MLDRAGGFTGGAKPVASGRSAKGQNRIALFGGQTRAVFFRMKISFTQLAEETIIPNLVFALAAFVDILLRGIDLTFVHRLIMFVILNRRKEIVRGIGVARSCHHVLA